MSKSVEVTLSDILKHAIDSVRSEKGRDDSVTAQILRDALAGWGAPCPFKAGDIVRPAKHSGSWKATLGLCIVMRLESGEAIDTSSSHPVSWDMRMIAISDNGATSEILGHSRDFELVPGV